MRVATIDSIKATNDEDIGLLVKELQRQAETRKDFVVPAKDIRAVTQDDGVDFAFDLGNGTPPVIFEATWNAHQNIAGRLDIQKNYYESMRERGAYDLMEMNLNYWAERDNRNFLVRTIDGKMRAVMSDRFRTLDNVELFFTAFKEANELGAKITRADLTENNFYMRFIHPDWATKLSGFRMDMEERRARRNDGGHNPVKALSFLDDGGDSTYLVPGIVIRNSDTGHGSMNAELFIFDLVCSNGLIADRTIHEVHLGKQLEAGYVSQETRELEDAAVWSRVRDLIAASFNEEKFQEIIEQIKNSASITLEAPLAAVETVVRNYSLSDEDKDAILDNLMSGGSNTVYGLISAVTAVGRDKSNYDDAVKYERAGGDILNDPKDFVRVQRHTRSARKSK